MRLRLVISPRRAPLEDLLRNHLQGLLDELPGRLPSYNRKQLLDDLCFLLRSPLFLYAISPRLRHATNSLRVNGLIKAENINVYALNMMIVRDGSSWATQLLHGGASFIEGRQYMTTEQAGFAQSFHWFCDEARFLSCEFHARELAAAEALGTVVSMQRAVVKPVQVDLRQTRARAAAQKQRRVVKLRIRYQMVYGRPVLTKGPR